MLLQASSNDQMILIIFWIVGFLFSLLISYYLCRWIFDIDKRVKQNESIINLLSLLAKKHGANNDEIHMATFNSKR